MRIHKLILPTPFAIGPVNVYLIEDRQLALFDTGPETPEAMTALDEQLEGAGHGIKEIRRIVISHTHSDHCGLAPKIQQASGASVFVHPWEENRLTRPFDDAPTARLLAQAGVPVEEIERYRLRRSYYEGARAGLSDVRLLRDGDELPFSSGSLRVIHTPGHTPGHICLFHEGGRFLLGGDTVLDRITPNPVMNPDPRQPDRRFPSLRMYHQTLDRLQSIAPVLIHTGHGADVAELASYRTNLLRHHRQRQQRVVELVGDGSSTAWEISQRLFPNLRGDQVFLAVSEASAHLDAATGNGLLRMEARSGIQFYERPSEGFGARADERRGFEIH